MTNLNTIATIAIVDYLATANEQMEAQNKQEDKMKEIAERIDHLIEQRELAVQRGDIGTVFSIDQVMPHLEEELNAERETYLGINKYWSQREVGPAELCLEDGADARFLTQAQEDEEMMGYHWWEDQYSRQSYGPNPHFKEIRYQHDLLKEEILDNLRSVWVRFTKARRAAAGNPRSLSAVKTKFEKILRAIRGRIMRENYAWNMIRQGQTIVHNHRRCILDRVWAPGLSKAQLKKLQGPPKPRPVNGWGLGFQQKQECLDAIFKCAQKAFHLGLSARKNGPWAIWEPEPEMHNRSGGTVEDGVPFPVNNDDPEAWEAYLKDSVEAERKELLLFSDYERKEEAYEDEEEPETWYSEKVLSTNLTYHCNQDELFGLYGDLNADLPIQAVWF